MEVPLTLTDATESSSSRNIHCEGRTGNDCSESEGRNDGRILKQETNADHHEKDGKSGTENDEKNNNSNNDNNINLIKIADKNGSVLLNETTNGNKDNNNNIIAAIQTGSDSPNENLNNNNDESNENDNENGLHEVRKYFIFETLFRLSVVCP